MSAISRYAKFAVALVGVISAWAATYFPNDPDVQKWVGLAVAVVTALSVYAVPNQPPAGEAKDPGISEQGHNDLGGIVVCAAVAVVVVVVAVLIGAID